MKKNIIYVSILFISLFMFSNISKVLAKETDEDYEREDVREQEETKQYNEEDWKTKVNESAGLTCNYEFSDNTTASCYFYNDKWGYQWSCYSHENNGSKKMTIKNKMGNFRALRYIKTNFNCLTYAAKKGNKIYLNTSKKVLIEYADITGNLKTSTGGSANVEKQSRTYSSGCEMFGGEDSATRKLIKWAISIIRYAIPIIIVVFGITDYLGALFSGEEKNMKEAQKKVIMRVVIGIIALLVPALIKLLVNLSGIVFNTGMNSGDIFCDFI